MKEEWKPNRIFWTDSYWEGEDDDLEGEAEWHPPKIRGHYLQCHFCQAMVPFMSGQYHKDAGWKRRRRGYRKRYFCPSCAPRVR